MTHLQLQSVENAELEPYKSPLRTQAMSVQIPEKDAIKPKRWASWQKILGRTKSVEQGAFKGSGWKTAPFIFGNDDMEC